ncbi:MAG: ATP-binding protein [Nocardioides sp.]
MPRPDVPPGPRRELVDALHDLHHRAGWPSLRTLAREAGCSHTTVSAVFSSPKVPSWGVLELLVEAMDGDTTRFHELWLTASGPPPNGTVPRSRIAGRRAELAAVRRHLESGTGLFLVTGEAGIGKTALVASASEKVGSFVATGHCLPLSTEVPLMPIVDVLRDIHAHDDGQWVKEALADCPVYVRSALGPLLPELGDDPAAAPVGEFARQHLFAAVARSLAQLHELKPLAVVLEDLHWADVATLDLLEHLATSTPRVPLVGTWRTEDLGISSGHAAWLARMQRAVGAACDLAPLTLEETTEQLRLRADEAMDRDQAIRIHDRSRGHPLFTEQLAAHAEGPGGGMPRLLAEVLDRRLEGLGDDAVTVTAVLGLADRGLTDSVLEEVTGLDHGRLIGALHELAARHLLTPDNSRTATLGHPLLAEAARRRVVPGEAPPVHRSLAAALGAQSNVDAAEVAEHWRQAEELQHELDWRVLAARQAHDRTAPGAEAQQWLRALEINDRLPESGFDAVNARLAAFDAFELDGETAAALDVVRGAMPGIEHLDDHRAAEVLRRVAMGEDWLSDDPRRGLSLVDQAIKLLAPHGPSEGLVRTLDLRANILIDLGLYDDALHALQQALDTCEELDDDGLFFATSATLAWHQAHLGDLDGALTIIGEARARVPGSAGPRREASMAMMHTDALIQHRRPAEEVMAAAARALEIGRELDMDFHLLTFVRANVVEALFNTGRVVEAAAALALLPVSDKYDHWPVSWMSGQVAIAEGRPGEGLESFRALDVTGATSENAMHRARWIAVAQLWLAKPEHAWAGLFPALEAGLDKPVVGDTCENFVVVARAGADVADRARGRAATVRRTLIGLRERAVVDPLGPAPAPIVRAAATAQWDAELARVDHLDTVEQWNLAATAWDALRSPHDAAYCRWRGAQVALRTGQSGLATKLLRRAAKDAREHVPLTEAIRETAARHA